MNEHTFFQMPFQYCPLFFNLSNAANFNDDARAGFWP